MPARVTYWTGVWDPAKEAISKEINVLRTGARSRAPVVAFSPGQRFRFERRDRTLVLPPRAWLALRGVAALVEPRGDVTHIFGARFSWHLFRSLGRRPILLTAVASHAGDAEMPASPAHVVVEADDDVAEWRRAGYEADRISVIRPGVDLDWYRRTPAHVPGRFTLLFASTPADPDEIEPRGIPMLVELARVRPDIEIVVPWRQWGDVAEARRRLAALHPPANFSVTHEDARDMRPYFARAHATVVSFAPNIGKSCPAFVVEGLAAGRPCLMSGGLSTLIDSHGAGIAVDRSVAALAAGVDDLRAQWHELATRARQLAEREFDVRSFQRRYDELYERLSSSRRSSAATAS